ncbi:MAG: LacI family DNA-binding transcriptional regulator [Chloroflexia bacterium]|nr:LacI family DNA-binding transcriptional regulator [Chloroflexia bacterium]
MATTIEDVAREAGVSIATVSRYLNGPGGIVAAETGSRVQAAVARLGYVPNSAARSLKTGKTGLIGVLLANIAHPYWSTVLAGVEEACQKAGYGAMVSSAADRADVEHSYLQTFLKQRVDGILLNPAHADPETVAAWARLRVPIVLIDRTLPGLPFPLVAMDNALGTRLAVEHLLALSHRRLGFVSWRPNGLSNREERLAGFVSTLEDAGVRADPGLIRFAADGWSDGVAQTLALLAQPDPPTAIVSANSTLNLQLLAAIKHRGRRVPADISVVGYDDSPWDPLLDPPLTTVATPAKALGTMAAERLIAAIAGADGQGDRELRLAPELLIRQSTGPVPDLGVPDELPVNGSGNRRRPSLPASLP